VSVSKHTNIGERSLTKEIGRLEDIGDLGVRIYPSDGICQGTDRGGTERKKVAASSGSGSETIGAQTCHAMMWTVGTGNMARPEFGVYYVTPC
jgi:hypothetical protein